MPDTVKLDYFFFRYAPFATMDDYITIGVAAMEENPNGFVGIRFSRNYRRVLCYFPDADLEYFEVLEQDLRTRLSASSAREEFISRSRDSFDNAIQLSPCKSLITNEPERALDGLARQAIDLPVARESGESSPQKRLQRRMEDVFEQAGVLGLLSRKRKAEPYTTPGDPFTIDFSYQPNGVVKMLQAIPLQTSVNLAIRLAFTYPRLAKGITAASLQQGHAVTTSMTAVVDDTDRNNLQIGFALDAMMSAQVNIAHAAQLPELADQIRRELRA